MHPLAERVASSNALLAREIEGEFDRLQRTALSERDAREKMDDALRRKDKAMGKMFKLLDAAKIDYSHLIS